MAKGKSIPDDVMGLLASADKARGFPAGTMFALMQQESGGNLDTRNYHYPMNAEGKRIAGHTGKISTASGPFGILDSTAKDPGYGLEALDKANSTLAQQIDWASRYLGARSKSAGGLPAGLAGYGEGAKYAQQVTARLPGNKAAVNPLALPDTAMPSLPEMVALQNAKSVAPMQPPQEVAAVPVPQPVVAQNIEADPWQQFQPAPVQAAAPVYERLPVQAAMQPDFRRFKALKGFS